MIEFLINLSYSYMSQGNGTQTRWILVRALGLFIYPEREWPEGCATSWEGTGHPQCAPLKYLLASITCTKRSQYLPHSHELWFNRLMILFFLKIKASFQPYFKLCWLDCFVNFRGSHCGRQNNGLQNMLPFQLQKPVNMLDSKVKGNSRCRLN